MPPNKTTPLLGTDAISSDSPRPPVSQRLVLSIAEAAEALGVSDDLVYELTERGELPCIRLGRRKVVPRRAVELVVEAALTDFDPSTALSEVSRARSNAAGATVLVKTAWASDSCSSVQ